MAGLGASAAMTFASISNLEAHEFGTLPNYPWDKSGWRVLGNRKKDKNGSYV